MPNKLQKKAMFRLNFVRIHMSIVHLYALSVKNQGQFYILMFNG
jgi:hypothetical protein